MTKHDDLSARGRQIAELERKYAELQLLCEEMRKEGLMTIDALSEGRDEAYRQIRGRMKSIKAALQVVEELPNAGRPPANDWYDDLFTECMNDAGRVEKNARELFFERASERRGVTDAKNQWAQAKRRSRSV
jgi:hypothetical protein